MSAVLALLAARRAGAAVFVREGKLVIQSVDPLPTDVMETLQEHRGRLVDMLSPQPTQPPLCAPCGRSQHHPDVVCSPKACPSWVDPDPTWPIATAYVPIAEATAGFAEEAA